MVANIFFMNKAAVGNKKMGGAMKDARIDVSEEKDVNRITILCDNSPGRDNEQMLSYFINMGITIVAAVPNLTHVTQDPEIF